LSRGVRSLQEQFDTTTPGGKLVFHLFGALFGANRCARTGRRASVRLGTAVEWPELTNRRYGIGY